MPASEAMTQALSECGYASSRRVQAPAGFQALPSDRTPLMLRRHVLTSAHASRAILRSRNPQFAYVIARRQFRTSTVRLDALKPSSPAPKDERTPATSSSSSNTPAPPVTPAEPLMTRVWAKVKHEASHYWHGSKLLVSEIRISRRLLFKLLRGTKLTRREHRQVCLL